jgi:hypothetical protein
MTVRFWVLASKEQPKESGWYLICDMRRNVYSVMGWLSPQGKWWEDGEYECSPTHWMRLPDPPKWKESNA